MHPVTYQVTPIANAPITAATTAPVASMPTDVPSSRDVKIGGNIPLWSKLDTRHLNDTEIAHRYCKTRLRVNIDHRYGARVRKWC